MPQSLFLLSILLIPVVSFAVSAMLLSSRRVITLFDKAPRWLRNKPRQLPK